MDRQNRPAYLNSCFGKLGGLGQLFASVDVRILSALERPLQLFQLNGRKGGSTSSLLALQRQTRFGRVRVAAVVQFGGRRQNRICARDADGRENERRKNREMKEMKEERQVVGGK